MRYVLLVGWEAESPSDNEHTDCVLSLQGEVAALRRFKQKLSRLCGRNVFNVDILHAHE